MSARILFALLFSSQLWGEVDSAAVVIDGQEVARVYGAVGPFNTKERAAEIERRIIGVAEKGYTGKFTTRSVAGENATLIVGGGIIVMAVTQLDAEMAGVPRNDLATQ